MRQWLPFRCSVCRVVLDVMCAGPVIAADVICRRCFNKLPPEVVTHPTGAACPLGG